MALRHRTVRRLLFPCALGLMLALPVGRSFAQVEPAELIRMRLIFEENMKTFEAEREQPGADRLQTSRKIAELSHMYLARLEKLRAHRAQTGNETERKAFEAEIARVRALPEVVQAYADMAPPEPTTASREPDPAQADKDEDEGEETLSAAERLLQRAQQARRPAGTLSDEDVASLLTEFRDEQSGVRYHFSASFHPVRPANRSQINRYASSGRVPYRITCSLVEIRPRGGREQRQLITRGSARFYLLDSEGKVVQTGSESLARMCPT